MKHKKSTQITAASVAENLVESWKSFLADPTNKETLNNFANVLDRDLRIKLPNGALKGILRGYEPEIRQDAAILVLDRYLAGNRNLTEATANGEIETISNELGRSMNAALRICRLRHSRRIHKEFRLREELDPEDFRLPTTSAASDLHFWELPYSIRHLLTLKLLQLAVTDHNISPKTANLAIEMLEGGLSQADMAKNQGVSRAAISQSVKMIRKELKLLASKIEGPLP